MVIDDEKDVLAVVKRGLEYNGFLVDAFDNPVEAIATFSQKQPDYYDMVLLDVRMPQMTGYEVYRVMRQINKRLQICFMTAQESLEEDFGRIFPDDLLDCVVKKPTKLVNLVKFVTERLARK